MANRKKSSKDAKPKTEKAEVVEPQDETVDAKAVAPEVDQTSQAGKPDEKAEDSAEADNTLTLENPIEEPSDQVDQPDDAVDAPDKDEDDGETVANEDKSKTFDDSVVLPEPTPTPVAAEQPGFFPLVLGGIVAAVIGFAASQFVMSDTGSDEGVIIELQDKIDSQTATIAALAERVDGQEGGVDLSALESAQADLEASISGLADRMTALEDQVSNIDIQPVVQGNPDADVAAYEQELKALRSEVDAMADNAARLEKNAQLAAQDTLKRAALTRVLTALDAGAGFEPALADLESLGVDVPAPLANAATGGVASLADLQESFPDAARAALSVSRDVSGGSDGGGLTSFLRSQLGARSLNPREGSDPDAVLSRVEAAIHEGRLSDVLAEIEALPKEGQAELSDWSSAVAHRQDAVAAAQTLSGALN